MISRQTNKSPFSKFSKLSARNVTAVVALARKLAGIMFAVWRDGTEFDPQLLRPRGAPMPA